jgi:KDO2-lipid IV(A) lauroyltransferase
MHDSKEKIRSSVAFEGEDHLRRALEQGRGVIALSAHLGNFAMIGARLAAAGYPFSVVVKQPKDERFARLIDHYRAVVGMQTISAKPRREAARQILKVLRRNEVILVIADEFKSHGVEVEFLGRTAPAPRGPATLALRTGAAVLPTFVTRDREDRLTLRIGAEIKLVKTGDLQGDVAANTSLFARHLEAMVRRYPDQWNWLGFHRDGRISRSEMDKEIEARASSALPQ